MKRFYRISQTGSKLPRRHSYIDAAIAAELIPGFEVFNGPMVPVYRTIGSPDWSVGSGDFTPRNGYHHFLLIDARDYKAHTMPGVPWSVIQTRDVEAVRILDVAELHAWLREQPACLGADNQLNWEATEVWVLNNRKMVETWLEDNSRLCATEFAETLLPRQDDKHE